MVIPYVSLTANGVMLPQPLPFGARVAIAYPFLTGHVAIVERVLRRGMAPAVSVQYLDQFNRVVGYWQHEDVNNVSEANAQACLILAQYQR